MIKIIIKNMNAEIIGRTTLEEAEVQPFIDLISVNSTFGKSEYLKEISPIVVDENGVMIAEAVFETVPSEYSVEIIDVTAELEQARINAEALAYLANTDYLIIREADSGVACPLDIKQLRADARLRIVR